MNRLEEIKKSVNEIEDYHPEERWEVLMDDVPALVAALEAVLELHEPVEVMYGNLACAECSWEEDSITVFYPCETVLSITKAVS